MKLRGNHRCGVTQAKDSEANSLSEEDQFLQSKDCLEHSALPSDKATEDATPMVVIEEEGAGRERDKVR